jgi:Resolvase, N terminal domain/Recombinase/Recombinase zinc beta ribbon domain
LLERAVSRVERGESHGIVVSKIDRFGRSLIAGIAAVERITDAGGVFVSVQDGLDLSTDTGRLVLRIMLSMAEWELERIRWNRQTACARAVARGVGPSVSPFGYRRRRDGRLEPDPATGPVVTELFRRRADGATYIELRAWLERENVRPPRSPRWRNQTLHWIFVNRKYLGEVRYGPHVKAGAHPPLTDAATWVGAQHPLQPQPPPARAEPALLRGLLRCAGCGRLMTTARQKQGCRFVVYRCDTDLPLCAARSMVRDSVAEPHIEALFWQELPKLRPAKDTRRLAALGAEVARHERDLANYRDNPRVISTLGVDRYEQGLAVRARRLERALLAQGAARRQCERLLPAPRELRERWPSLSLPDRAALLRSVFDCVFVRRARSPEPRLHACPRGTAPPDLPSNHSPYGDTLKPVDPDSLPRAPALSKAARRPWTETRLRAALDPLLADRRCWPPFGEFQAAGLALAYRQVELCGGSRRWAGEYGLTRENRVRPISGWSEERVCRELGEFLQGRDRWPTAKEFAAANRAMLGRATAKFGGKKRWAAQFHCELRPNQLASEWTDQKIEEALRSLSCDGTMPTLREMQRSGMRGLASAVGPSPHRERWAERLGLRPLPRSKQGPKRWTDETIETSLRGLLRRRRVYPTQNEFKAAGLDGLYQRLGRMPGGHSRCAEEHGLARASTSAPAR